MSNPLHLIPKKKYRVIKSFKDYDGVVHPIGETWTFIGTNFVPYDDGLSLHIMLENSTTETVYRLQWRAEEQEEIIQNFGTYVEMIG
jgi:hypothetical protein